MQSKAVVRSTIINVMIELCRASSVPYSDLTDISTISRICFDRCLIDGTAMEINSIVDHEMWEMAFEGIIEDCGYCLFRICDVLTAFTLAVDAA